MAPTKAIALSIRDAILDSDRTRRRPLVFRLLSLIVTFFTLYRLKLTRIRNDLFRKLRAETWYIDDDGYNRTFQGEDALETIGDMGFSGSSFFNTSDGKYLIKSVPRRFEHSFFRDDLLQPYTKFMTENPKSFLIRITDFLGWRHISIGGIIGIVPNYHIVMENLLVGKEEAKKSGGGDWENWDLKPIDYFFPERDIADGKLTSEATKSKLADKFEGKLTLKQSEADELMKQLESDTEFLSQYNAVDYSLFLVRIPLSQPQNPFADQAGFDNAPEPPEYPPFAPPEPPSWRTGVRSADGKYIYRAAVLDFFWAKHKTQPKFMTMLINAWNLVDRQGHMSITTNPKEYKERFLGMCKGFLEIKD